MTNLQRLIRERVQQDGQVLVSVGRNKTTPATMATIKCLTRAGYLCQLIEVTDNHKTYKVTGV